MAESNGVAADRLKSFIERVERLEDDKAAVADDIKEVYAEAKAEGFDPKIMRKIVMRRRKPLETREEDELRELYEGAIEGLPRIPRRDVRQLDLEDAVSAADSTLEETGNVRRMRRRSPAPE